METLQVALGTRSYPVYIGNNLLEKAALITPHLSGKQVLIVSNETVAPLYLEKLLALLPDFQTSALILPDGEEYKTFTVLNQIFDHLLQQKFDRQTTLIALGGGVVGDITGFAAACYQRGVSFIQIPTTLLAQVDASVGGKTGINHPLGKNMIGAFHQPRCVIIDTDTLKTLPKREFCAGLAEVIKYGLINDYNLFEWLETHILDLLAGDANALRFAIMRSCGNKAQIVADDEREIGQRALLNLGHTFAHAIETGLNYSHLLHGEAVAIGLHLSAQLSAHLGWITHDVVERIQHLIEQANLPTDIPNALTVEQLLTAMQLDKKVQAGKVRLVLLQAIGKAIITDDYDPTRLYQTLAQGYKVSL